MVAFTYYNEHDPKAAAWLRELIKRGLIADGEVDERSIADVQPADVRRFVQCHWFAGIGGWSLALRRAGWPDDRPVWTGSCPCQPFSSAGTQAGGNDPRDLWPAWHQLIRECRPPVVFGEQVEAAIAHGWLDRLCDDLEREGYAVGAVCLPAASVGAFHIRQRLWFVANTDLAGLGGLADTECRTTERQRHDVAGEASGAEIEEREQRVWNDAGNGGVSYIRMADAEHTIGWSLRRPGEDECHGEDVGRQKAYGESGACGPVRQLADTDGEREIAEPSVSRGAHVERAGGFWADAEWLPCTDGKARPVEPGSFPLAYGVPARVGRLRGYGNAIVPQVAAEFIGAYLDLSSEHDGLHRNGYLV